jgi:hypothetical protein
VEPIVREDPSVDILLRLFKVPASCLGEIRETKGIAYVARCPLIGVCSMDDAGTIGVHEMQLEHESRVWVGVVPLQE